jgi:proteasome lid subunit RPN8/RPN11
MDLRRAALDAIVDHARRDAPNECCGLLIGSEHRIDEAVPARNARSSPTRYEVDPSDHFAVIRRVRREGRAVVGAYHSHVLAPPVPSPTDVAEAYDEQLLHVIVSLQNPPDAEVRAYRIRNGNFHEVPLVTVP